MEPDGLGIVSGLAAAIGSVLAGGDTAVPPDPILPQSGGAAIELRLSGEDYAILPDHILTVQLRPAGCAVGDHLHRQVMDLVVRDRVLLSPVIQESILGGRIAITGSLTAQEAADLADQIAGHTPCDPPQSPK